MIQLLTNERAFVGTKERKVREKEQRKETILSAAVQIIAEKGFECATMEDIAAGSELSKGTLYLYFEDKSSLFRAIKTEAHDQIRSIFESNKTFKELINKQQVLSAASASSAQVSLIN